MTAQENRTRFPRLAAWWEAAKKAGIYSRADVSRSGMSATVLLWTVIDGRLVVAWPDTYAPDGSKSDVCARELGFSQPRRAFRVNGCGFDRAHEVAYRIAALFEPHEGGAALKSIPRMEELNRPE